jgi:hypothetical protein
VIPSGWAALDARCGTDTLAHPRGTRLFIGGAGTEGRTGATADGVTWVDTTTTSHGPTVAGHTRNLIRGLGYGGGLFVAVGGYDNSYISVSCDGTTWRQDVLGTNIEAARSELPAGFNEFLSDVAYLDGAFVAAGGQGKRLRSADGGVSWAVVGGTAGGLFRGIEAGNGLFVAAGENNMQMQSMTSVSDDGGLTWSTAAIGPFGALESLAFGNGVFVAVGQNECIFSDDGLAWTACEHDPANALRVIFSNGTFYLAHGAGHLTSTDGETWEDHATALPQGFAFGDGRYVGARSNTMRGFTMDLMTWTEAAAPGVLRDFNTGFVP